MEPQQLFIDPFSSRTQQIWTDPSNFFQYFYPEEQRADYAIFAVQNQQVPSRTKLSTSVLLQW